MGKSVRGGSMGTFRAVWRPAVVAVAGVAILLSGCSQDATQSEGPKAKPVAATTQAPQDIAAKLAADVKKLKDDAAKAAEVKAAATTTTMAAAAKAAAAKAAAAKAAKAKTAIKHCREWGPQPPTGRRGGLGAGPNTSCAFATKVWKEMPEHFEGKQVSYDVKSPVTGASYRMTCVFQTDVARSRPFKEAGTYVCRGGQGAVVYIGPWT